MFNDDKFNKFHNTYQELAKADMSLEQALQVARKHNPDAGKVIAKHLYTDQKIPKMGNFFAYKDFSSRHSNDGTHLSLDFNSFGAINKEHGFEAGDEAIHHGMNKISDVSRKFGGKAFRIGGDESRLWFPSADRAHGFVKELKEGLKTLPKIRGNHQISVSIGMGHNADHAEKALMHAKDYLGPLVHGKRQKIHPPGQEPTVSHSLLHESPPPGWKPATGNFPPVQSDPIATPGLKVANPLKAPKIQ